MTSLELGLMDVFQSFSIPLRCLYARHGQRPVCIGVSLPFQSARARMETDAEDSCKIKRQKLLPTSQPQSICRLPFAQQTSCTVPHTFDNSLYVISV